MSEMGICQNCGWFRRAHSYLGDCANPKNSEVKHVGGGAEYSSSERCLVAPRVQANWGCDKFEAFKRDKIVERAKIIEHPRTPDLQPWESNKWEIAQPIEATDDKGE